MCGCHDPGVFGHQCGRRGVQRTDTVLCYSEPMGQASWLAAALERERQAWAELAGEAR